jgi:hypothetical protein
MALCYKCKSWSSAVRLTQCEKCGTLGRDKVQLHMVDAQYMKQHEQMRAALEPFARAYYGFRERGELVDVNTVIPVNIRFGDLIAAFEAHEGDSDGG